MPLLSLVQELLGQGNADCLDGLCNDNPTANTFLKNAEENIEKHAADNVSYFIKAELQQFLSEESYCRFINDYEPIPSDIALEIERRITPRIVNHLQYLNISDFKKETLVRKCMRQILAEN